MGLINLIVVYTVVYLRGRVGCSPVLALFYLKDSTALPSRHKMFPECSQNVFCQLFARSIASTIVARSQIDFHTCSQNMQ